MSTEFSDQPRYHPLAVQRVIQETADTKSFVLTIPRELEQAFTYQAGQFLTFQTRVGAQTLSRCYSLASSPESDGEHKVTIKRVEGGRVSNWFNDQVRAGDTLDVMEPAGLFVLREGADDRPLMLFGGGSGVTPVIAILKTALLTTQRSIRMVYANRDTASIIFHDELRQLAEAHPDRLDLIHHLDSEAGYLTVDSLRERLDGFEEADCYICGPGPFMDVVEATLADAGIEKSHVFLERFVSPPDPAPDEDHRFHTLTVGRVIEETADARSFELDVPAGLTETFSYVAGQFLTFRVQVGDQTLTRCYSIPTTPGVDEGLKVTVKRVVDGRVSNWFNDTVSTGTSLDVMPPAGCFTLDEGERPVLLFAGGSGITPVISILKQVVATTSRKARLLYANRDQASVIFADELAGLSRAAAEQIEIRHHLDDQSGLLTAQAVRDAIADFSDADVYLCGPGPFMDLVEGELRVQGALYGGKINIERFVSPHDPDESAAAEPATGVDCKASIILRGATHELHVPAGTTVLMAVREAGLKPPFACEDGYCGCCMAKLHSGDVNMRLHDALTAAEVAENWILTCQALPQSETCEINYDEA